MNVDNRSLISVRKKNEGLYDQLYLQNMYESLKGNVRHYIEE